MPTFAKMQNNRLSVEKILSNLEIEALNPMQVAAGNAIKTKDDVILLSSTGSGKTIGFLLPVVQALDSKITKVQTLVLVPSRELAMQIEQVFKKMATGFKVTVCYGGHLRETEENNLIQPPAVIIGTAGRVADHIRRNNFELDNITTLVLDEFDIGYI